ncbi:MAG: hypothetical protein V1696_01760 [Candidatus Jorgensenbacteria bacterium]
MGQNKKVLNITPLTNRVECGSKLALELCETIHLHYRDLRIEMDGKTLKILTECLKDGANKHLLNPKLSGTDFLMLSDKRLGTNKINNDKLKVELLKNNLIHIHYRNIRLELTIRNFIKLFDGLSRAFNKLILDEYISNKNDEFEEKYIDIDKINPYDIVHKEDLNSPYGYTSWNAQEVLTHEKGIKIIAKLIKNGHKLLPVSVIPIRSRGKHYSGPIKKGQKYQRLDGFKRYIAWKRLGYKKMLCHVYKKAKPGNQRYKPLVIG